MRKPCDVSEEPQPLRLRDAKPARCIVESDPQPKNSPFETVVEWGACGKDDKDAVLFTWDGKYTQYKCSTATL